MTGKERDRIIKAGYKDKFRKIGPDHYEMKSKKGICPYLDKKDTCTIHNARPLACRCFPVHPEYIKGKRTYLLEQCPLGKILTKKEIDTMKKAAQKMPADIIKNRFKRSRLPKSELKLILKQLRNFRNVRV